MAVGGGVTPPAHDHSSHCRLQHTSWNIFCLHVFTRSLKIDFLTQLNEGAG